MIVPTPPQWKNAKLFPSSCFEDSPGVILCGYADSPEKPDACFYLLATMCGADKWEEILKECRPAPPKSYGEEIEEHGI
jgi:hypothetical protein